MAVTPAADDEHQEPASEVAPPPAYARRRWIPLHRAEWAQQCAQIIRDHGAVTSQIVYEKRDQARWRARYLMKLLGELDVYQRWQLREHVDRKSGGYVWTVEYVGGEDR